MSASHQELSGNPKYARVPPEERWSRASGATSHKTMVSAGGNWLLEAHKRPFVLRRRVGMIGDNPPSKRIYFLWGGMVYGPQKAPMLRRRIIAVTNEHFWGHKPFNPPQKVYSLARGVVPNESNTSAQDARPLVGL